VTIVAVLLVLLMAPVWASSQGEKSGTAKVSGKIQFLVADGPPMKDYLEALTKDFMKENPGVEVEMIWVPWGQFETKIIAMHTGGVAPDLHQVDDDTIPFFGRKGLVMPMGDLLATEGIKKEDYAKIVWDLTSVDGKIYAITLALKPRATVYNVKMFREAGISAPDKWANAWSADDFLTAAKKLVVKDATGKVSRYAWMWDYWCWDWIPYSNGGSFFSQDMTTYTFDSPAVVEAMQYVADTAYKHGVAIPYATQKDVGGDSLFASEKIAMYQSGIWSVNVLRTKPNLEWDIMPHFKIFKSAGTECSLFTFAIPKTTKNKSATYRFAKFMLGQQAQTAIAGAGRFMPIKKTAYTDNSFLQPDQLPKRAKLWEESLEYQGRWPFNFNGPEMRETIKPNVDILWAGEITAAESLKKPKKDVEKQLTDLRAMK